MSKPKDVAVIVGSLREASLSRRLAQSLGPLAPSNLALESVQIAGLPLYDDDAELNAPAPWLAFRERIRRADAVLFVTPEYNRSIPAPLKNAIDVGSRPYGKSSWNAKPGAIVSLSLGGLGGFGANHHLRQCLVYLNVFTMQQPEAYISGAAELFNPDGTLANDRTRDFLSGFMTAFAGWVATHTPGR